MRYNVDTEARRSSCKDEARAQLLHGIVSTIYSQLPASVMTAEEDLPFDPLLHLDYSTGIFCFRPLPAHAE